MDDFDTPTDVLHSIFEYVYSRKGLWNNREDKQDLYETCVFYMRANPGVAISQMVEVFWANRGDLDRAGLVLLNKLLTYVQRMQIGPAGKTPRGRKMQMAVMRDCGKEAPPAVGEWPIADDDPEVYAKFVRGAEAPRVDYVEPDQKAEGQDNQTGGREDDTPIGAIRV